MTAKPMVKWDYLPHQVDWGDRLYEMIKQEGFAILASEERTGKTGTFIKVAEMAEADKILILTKKAAISGIEDHIANLLAIKDYTVINYQSIHKLDTDDYDFIILDEFHQALCSYPKPSETFKSVLKLTKDTPILYVSATPFSETYAQAYHSLKLSSWSPFKHKTFYQFHKEYGVETIIYIGGRQAKQYNCMQDWKIKPLLSKHILKSTRKDIGFKHEPDDVLHTIHLSEQSKADIKMYKKTQMKHVNSTPIPLESTMAEMNSIYLRGGGMVEHEKECYQLSTEKVDYILEFFGDTEDVAIMAHYVCEQKMLAATFSNATTLSSTAHAEGVDLHKYKSLIIYSMGFSTSKFIQRRARQCNINREDPIEVHYLIADGCIDKKLYDTVSQKRSNFTARIYNDE